MSDGVEPSPQSVLAARGLSKRFSQGADLLTVLDHIEFDLQCGQRVAIVGQSGAGKSTLLHLLGGLDLPSGGEVWLAGQPLNQLSETARGRLRNRNLGFIYQFHHLLPEFTARENVALPLMISGVDKSEARARAADMLEQVGLGERLRHKPGELSGGERQRAAVARALICEPACVLADEPTGNLDRYNAERVFELMIDLNQRLRTSLVLVTHDTDLAAKMDAVWVLRDGKLATENPMVAG